MTWAAMKAMEGRRVTAKTGTIYQGIVTGILVKLEDDGGFIIDTDDFGRRYCWPALEMVLAE